jgi:hypothetical protein
MKKISQIHAGAIVALCSFSVLNLFAVSTASADTMVYYRMGDDTSLTTDSSGNGNTLTSTATQVEISDSGDGSAFSDPISLTGDSNDYTASFSGGQSMSVADPFGEDGLSDFTVEAYINLASYSTSTQYVVGQWSTTSWGRSWAIGVADSDGTGDAEAGELYILLGDGVSGAIIIPLGLTVDLDTDYYFALTFDSTTDTDDITFYYQDLTNDSSLVVTTISSTITSVNNTSADLTVGSYNGTNSEWSGLIDEVRISDTILSTSELLISVPEPSSFALLTGLLALGCVVRRPRRV